MERRFHLLVRGVVIKGGYLLIVRDAVASAFYSFLPGGHVEIGESLVHALSREFNEELGVSGKVGRYLGAIEHSWRRQGVQNYEINHFFEVEPFGLEPPLHPPSKEAKLAFSWVPVDQLQNSNLQPEPLQKLVLADPDSFLWWASTLGQEDGHR